VEKMNLTASEFDKDHYFMRKFVSNQIVFMYTKLLSQYDVNAAHINRHIIAYFIRLSKFSIKNGNRDDDAEFDDALGKNELATKPSTMEPMLYNIGLLTVLDRVLNDPTIRDKEDFAALLMFASSFMSRFARAAEVNPMLYVEALFKHPIPHRFCELATNLYVNEELRMIAVRDLLLEDQRRYERAEDEDAPAEEDVNNSKAPRYEDDEEEVEFDDDGLDADGIFVQIKRHRKFRKTRKSKMVTSTIPEDEERSGEEEEGSEVEFNEKADDDVSSTFDSQDIAELNRDEGDAIGSTENVTSLSTVEVVASEESTQESPALSGNKRIRKSLEKDNNDDSDDEDFLGSAVPAKFNKRFIFDDDDDDDD
jgi:timeless